MEESIRSSAESLTSAALEDKWVTTPCGMCCHECGVSIHVKDGKALAVKGWAEHPLSRGFTCVKGREAVNSVYSDARIKYPMKRVGQRGEGKWQRITWDEALDTIAARLQQDKEKYGPNSLATFVGDPVTLVYPFGMVWIERFSDVYGTQCRFQCFDLCAASDFLGQHATTGYGFWADIENTMCVILWSQNPHQGNPAAVQHLLAAKKRGAKLFYVDPRRNQIASAADIHIRPKPGTDGVILLAMLNTIITEDLYDKEFVRNWTVGFDKLAERVRQYTAEEAERVSGVKAEDIRAIARTFAAVKPACIEHGWKVNQCRNGFSNSRAMTSLLAITGNLEVPGGAVRAYFIRGRNIKLPKMMGPVQHIGQQRTPAFATLFRGWINWGSMVNWGDLVLGEPKVVRNAIVASANPAVNWPNTKKVRKALDSLDFLVVMELTMTATAERADIVLPACTFLEKFGGYTNMGGYFLRRKIVEPQWESWSEFKFWSELARRMGYQEHFPWKDEEEAFDWAHEPGGLTLRKLLEEHPSGFIHPRSFPGNRDYEKNGFPTPSRKVELYSERLEKLGLDPLPTYLEPVESLTPEILERFPLILTTGTKEVEYWHSQHRHLEALKRRNPYPRAQIHPDAAKRYGIIDDEPMIIETETGSLEIRARVTEEVLPDCVTVPHAWPEAPENMLVDDTPVDRVSGYPNMTAIPCSVKKKA